MEIQRSSQQSIKPMIKPPETSLQDMKTPTQKKVEHESNLSNHKVQRIAKQSLEKTYETLRNAVKNTEFNVSYSVGKMGESKQFKFTLKNTGEEIVSLPPKIAVNMAERARQSTIGMLVDARY